jgi:beta-carotene ketolase (CrtO type)
LIIGATAISPADLSQFSHVHRGHLTHVDVCLSQIGPWRPTKSLSGYKTPIAGLWHTGAGAHPFGYVHGWPGRATAREMLRLGARRHD